MAEPEIRGLLEADLPRILDLEKELFAPDDWSEGMYRDELSHADRVYLARCVGETLIGWGGIWVSSPHAELLTIGVDPAHRRHGHASALLARLVALAHERGAREMFLEVRAEDAGAQALYRAFGFRQIGLRRRYYPRSGADALVMKARIADGATVAPGVPLS